MNGMSPEYRQYSTSLQPQKQVSSSPYYEEGIAESYNNGNGFTPLPTNNRGSALFQNNNKNSNKSSRGPPDYSNGGAAAGRSCLVVPSFGSGKKKKKKEKHNKIATSPTRTPKKRGGGLFGRSTSSTESVSTSAESSMADPYHGTHSNHNDKKSLLKSFGKKKHGGNNDARDWYLETMVEEDETNDQGKNHNNSHSNHRPLQQNDIRNQEKNQQPYPQFIQPPRGSMGTNLSSPSTNVIPNLLQLPKAEDRSHEARSRQNKMHAYQGELEPEGVRGQEATTVNNNRSSRSSPMHEVQRPSPHMKSDNQTPVMRDFTASNQPESSSKVLPIRQVVSNRQRQIQNALLESPGGHGNRKEYDKGPNHRMEQHHAVKPQYSPKYKKRMNVASSVLHSGRFPSEYSGYDEDVEHEEMISHNRAEFEREHKQQQQGRQMYPRSRKDESVGSDDLQSMDTPTPSKSSRRSAPVNIDDSSFENPQEHIQGIHAMAMEHVAKGEYDMALQAFQQVLAVYTKEYGESHPLTASAHHNLGTVHTKRAGLLPDHTLHQRHCREQALHCFQAAARSARDCPTLGPNHPNVAVSLVRIGFLLLQARQYQNAVITFEEALRIRTKNYGLNHGLVANLFNNLGVCHMHLQQFSEGRENLLQALDIQKELLSQDRDESSTSLLELADTLCNIGGLNLEWIRRQGPDARRTTDAESAFMEALELRSKVLGEDHALTNQVRSLHDMIRSLPMPSSAASSSHSSMPGKMTAFGGEYSPAAVSDMTNSVAKQSIQDRSTLSAESTNTSVDIGDTSALSIPSLRFRSDQPSFPPKRSAPQSNRENSNGDNEHFMDIYDATEESCLLRKPVDDEQSASQTGGFVTYARSAVSNGTESNQNDNDRVATMRQVRDLLDSHENFMDSPNRDIKAMERTIDERDSNAHEDGIVPLAGNWPGPKNINKLSPGILNAPSENLHIIHNCAVSYMTKGRHTEAVALLEMIVECQKQKHGTLHAHVGSAVHNVGIAYLRGQVNYKAFQSFEEAVRVRKAALGRDHPVVAVSLVKFGISLMLLQRHEDSLWIFRDALAIRKQSLGDLHPSNARIYNNIGCVHVELGELDDARNNFESALDIQRNTLLQNSNDGPMIFGTSTTLQNLGYLYGKRGMDEKAAMVLREALSLQERIMPPAHPTVLSTLESLAETCLEARRFTHALKYYRELFDRSQSLDPLDLMKQALTLQTMATIHGVLNDPKSKRKKLEMALKFVRSMGVENYSGGDAEMERLEFERSLMGELKLDGGGFLLREDNRDWV